MADEKDKTAANDHLYDIEVAFGEDLDDIDIVDGEGASELGAREMTMGPDVFDGTAPDTALAAEEMAHVQSSGAPDDGRGARETASQAATALNSAQMAQPSPTVANGQYQQAVQNNDETVAADAVAVEDEKREYEIERAEDQEAKALEAEREQELAEQERQREEQEAREREEREREEREEREREEREREEREDAERADEDADGYDY